MVPHEVAALARALGDALSTAHAAGVVHGSVTPGSVRMSTTGPKLLGFGAAHGGRGATSYCAPELLARDEPTPASDQFAFGATLYEALSGRRAFAGEDALRIARRIAMEPPSPVAPLDRTTARIDRVLARGMAKAPGDRYASCAAFGEALSAALLERTAC